MRSERLGCTRIVVSGYRGSGDLTLSIDVEAIGLSDGLNCCSQRSVASGCFDSACDNISLGLIAWHAVHSLGHDLRSDLGLEVGWKGGDSGCDYGTGLTRIGLSDFGDHSWDDRVGSSCVVTEGSTQRLDGSTRDVSGQAWKIGDNGQNSFDNCSLISRVNTLKSGREFSLDLGRKGLGLDGGDTCE